MADLSSGGVSARQLVSSMSLELDHVGCVASGLRGRERCRNVKSAISQKPPPEQRVRVLGAAALDTVVQAAAEREPKHVFALV